MKILKTLEFVILMLLVNWGSGSIFARNNSKKEAFSSFKETGKKVWRIIIKQELKQATNMTFGWNCWKR